MGNRDTTIVERSGYTHNGRRKKKQVEQTVTHPDGSTTSQRLPSRAAAMNRKAMLGPKGAEGGVTQRPLRGRSTERRSHSSTSAARRDVENTLKTRLNGTWISD